MDTNKHRFTEGKHEKRGLSATLLAWISVPVLIVVLFVFWPAVVPEYQGKSLTAWLEQLDWRHKSIERKRAGEGIKAIGAKALPYLRGQLQRTDSEPMRWLAKEIGRPFTYTPAMDYKLRALAAITILGTVARDCEPELNEMLKRGELPHQVAPAIAAVNSNAVNVLLECLSHTNSRVRDAAAASLKDVGPHDRQTIGRLLEVFDDPDEAVRKTAGYSLGAIHLFPEVVVPRLTAGLGNTNRYSQVMILSALRSYGTNALIAVVPLKKLVNETTGTRKGDVAATLRTVDAEAASDAGFGNSNLLKMLRSPDSEDRLVANVTVRFTRANPPEFIPALIECLADTNQFIRMIAVGTLGNYGVLATNALQPLTRLLESSPEAWGIQVPRTIKKIDPTWVATNSIRN